MISGDHQSPNPLLTGLTAIVSPGGRRDLSGGSIVLTDSPLVVSLKREFRRLDAREQELKEKIIYGTLTRALEADLQRVRNQKAEIATAIFQA